MQQSLARSQNDAASYFLRGQALNNQQQQESQRFGEEVRRNRTDEQFRYDQLQQNEDQFNAMRDEHQQDRAATAPNQTIYDAEGNQYEGNDKQAAAARNLATMGENGGDFNEGLRQILGLPEPMENYQAPDGSVVRVPRKQLPALLQRDQVTQQKQDQADKALQQKQAASQATVDARYAAIDSSATTAANRLDLGLQALQQKTTNAEERKQIGAARAQAKTQLQLADNGIAEAKAALEAYHKAQPYVKNDDPDERALRQAVELAYQEKKKVLADHIAAANHAEHSGSLTGPAGTVTPATSPAAVGPATSARSAAAAAPTTASAADSANSGPVQGNPPLDTNPPKPASNDGNDAGWLRYRIKTNVIPPYKAMEYLQHAGGDKEKARQAAIADGWRIE